MLTKLLETIRPLDENAMESARLHWDALQSRCIVWDGWKI